MSVDRADFAKFFAAVNSGHSPFRWQERLLDTLLENGRWPDRIAAPTGSGKTSAIDVHVFATALTSSDADPRLPRRLALVVDRRVLVDDQYLRARTLADVLEKALITPENDHVAEVAELLARLSGAGATANRGAAPLVTARLRGGFVPSRSWRDDPTACAVLCATPDMWGSRLLFRGYGSADEAAPREAGLLAYDSVVLVDEAHLARQLLETARRVARLAPVAQRPLPEVPALQVVEVSATPAREAGANPATVAVEEDDLADTHLRDRLTRPKPVTLAEVAEWPASRLAGKVAAELAKAVIAMRTENSAIKDEAAEDRAATIGCYVNTVPMALAVADALRRESLCVVTVCGQVRPADLRRLDGGKAPRDGQGTDLDGAYPGLLSIGGNKQVDVLVTTQSLEVGADLDLAGIVTELASGSALAQRAGRANRLGKRPQAPVTVVVPPAHLPDKARSGPYPAAELNDALDWLHERAGTPLGLAPWAVRESPPPSARPRRLLYQRPELGDAWHWARTSDDLAAEPELDLWLSDSFEESTSVGLVVRDALPEEPTDAVAFVRDLPPARWEVFPVPYRSAQEILAELHESGTVMIKVRGDDVAPSRLLPGDRVDVRPGDLVVIDSSAAVFTRVSEGEFSPPVAVASATDDPVDGADAPRRGRADDVLHYQPEPQRGRVALRVEWSASHERIAGFARETSRRIIDAFAADFEDQTERTRRDSLAQLLGAVQPDAWPVELRPTIKAAISLLRGKVEDSEIVLHRGLEDECRRILVSDNRRAVADEDLRQVYTPRGAVVFLRNHQHDVAARAVALASALRFPAELADSLRVAGEHHDDGKADRRFQEGTLDNHDGGELLAKSRPGKTRREVRERQAGGLPTRWRHEQRSVVDSLTAVRAVPGIDPDLALRLIGTSHGRGRSGFPHTAAELAGPDDGAQWRELAESLFDSGGWDELIEVTQVRYGAWGCAYLEAVLRAADCQVSREGK